MAPVRAAGGDALWAAKAYAASALLPGAEVTRFVVLTEGRTGSEALVRRLGSHPEVLCDGEVLKHRRCAPERLLAGRSRLAGWRGCRAYGLKVKGDHLSGIGPRSGHGPLRHLADHGWRVVHLTRRDRLRQAVSGYRAQLSGRYHVQAGEPLPGRAVRLDPPTLIQLLTLIDAAQARDRRLLEGIDAVELVYEDDLLAPGDQDRAVNHLLGVLGLPEAPTRTTLVRVAAPDLRADLANYDEVAAALRDTPWSAFLDTPGPVPPG